MNRHLLNLLLASALGMAAACYRPCPERYVGPIMLETDPVRAEDVVASPDGDRARNVILFVGDGMGIEHVRAGSLFVHGRPDAFLFQAFPTRGQVETYSNELCTDSAAGATAMATGHRVDNGVIGLDDDGEPLTNLSELNLAAGRAVGIVTTAPLTHATPAGFTAHATHRIEREEIAMSLLDGPTPQVLLGGGDHVMTADLLVDAGYDVVRTRDELLASDGTRTAPFGGVFSAGAFPWAADGPHPNVPELADMTRAALDVLEDDEDGFFLVVEGARIDMAAHDRNLRRNVHETAEFAEAIEAAYAWAEQRDDTLIVVTADHETGGLQTRTAENVPGEVPRAQWTAWWHTPQNVPLYAWGVGADRFAGTLQNTDIFHLLRSHLVAGNEDSSPGDAMDAEQGGDAQLTSDTTATGLSADPPMRRHRLNWDPAWPQIRTWEYFATPALIATTWTIDRYANDPGPTWRRQNPFDDTLREWFRYDRAQTRERAHSVSNTMWYATQLYPLLVDTVGVTWIGDRNNHLTLQMAMMNLEAYFVTGLFVRSFHKFLGRARPFVQDCDTDPDFGGRCDSSTRNLSFPSGHTALAATGAGLVCAHHRYLPLYGGGWADRAICAVAATSAGVVGLLRLGVDRHWATDVFVGYGVGFAVGYGLPIALHYGAAPDRTLETALVPWFGDGTHGLQWVGTF